MFGFVDILLIVLVGLFVLSGFFYGFIRTFGNLVGLIIGILAASWGTKWLGTIVDINNRPILVLFIFIAIASLAAWLVGWLVNLIEGLRKLMVIIPFLKSINSLLGAVFGFVEGIVTLTAIAFFTATYMPDGGLRDQILGSKIIQLLSNTTGFIYDILFPAMV